MIGCNDILYTHLVTIGNYGATPNFVTTSYRSLSYTLGISVFISRILATDFSIVVIPVSL
jgi:hypothetical protein